VASARVRTAPSTSSTWKICRASTSRPNSNKAFVVDDIPKDSALIVSSTRITNELSCFDTILPVIVMDNHGDKDKALDHRPQDYLVQERQKQQHQHALQQKQGATDGEIVLAKDDVPEHVSAARHPSTTELLHSINETLTNHYDNMATTSSAIVRKREVEQQERRQQHQQQQNNLLLQHQRQQPKESPTMAPQHPRPFEGEETDAPTRANGAQPPQHPGDYLTAQGSVMASSSSKKRPHSEAGLSMDSSSSFATGAMTQLALIPLHPAACKLAPSLRGAAAAVSGGVAASTADHALLLRDASGNINNDSSNNTRNVRGGTMKPFPLVLGRTNLANWWWKSCPCQHYCRLHCRPVAQNIKSLSKVMIQLDTNGAVHVAGKNPHLVTIVSSATSFKTTLAAAPSSATRTTRPTTATSITTPTTTTTTSSAADNVDHNTCNGLSKGDYDDDEDASEHDEGEDADDAGDGPTSDGTNNNNSNHNNNATTTSTTPIVLQVEDIICIGRRDREPWMRFQVVPYLRPKRQRHNQDGMVEQQQATIPNNNSASKINKSSPLTAASPSTAQSPLPAPVAQEPRKEAMVDTNAASQQDPKDQQLQQQEQQITVIEGQQVLWHHPHARLTAMALAAAATAALAAPPIAPSPPSTTKRISTNIYSLPITSWTRNPPAIEELDESPTSSSSGNNNNNNHALSQSSPATPRGEPLATASATTVKVAPATSTTGTSTSNTQRHHQQSGTKRKNNQMRAAALGSTAATGMTTPITTNTTKHHNSDSTTSSKARKRSRRKSPPRGDSSNAAPDSFVSSNVPISVQGAQDQMYHEARKLLSALRDGAASLESAGSLAEGGGRGKATQAAAPAVAAASSVAAEHPNAKAMRTLLQNYNNLNSSSGSSSRHRQRHRGLWPTSDSGGGAYNRALGREHKQHSHVHLLFQQYKTSASLLDKVNHKQSASSGGGGGLQSKSLGPGIGVGVATSSLEQHDELGDVGSFSPHMDPQAVVLQSQEQAQEPTACNENHAMKPRKKSFFLPSREQQKGIRKAAKDATVAAAASVAAAAAAAAATMEYSPTLSAATSTPPMVKQDLHVAPPLPPPFMPTPRVSSKRDEDRPAVEGASAEIFTSKGLDGSLDENKSSFSGSSIVSSSSPATQPSHDDDGEEEDRKEVEGITTTVGAGGTVDHHAVDGVLAFTSPPLLDPFLNGDVAEGTVTEGAQGGDQLQSQESHIQEESMLSMPVCSVGDGTACSSSLAVFP
jgi:hypothetical protein